MTGDSPSVTCHKNGDYKREGGGGDRKKCLLNSVQISPPSVNCRANPLNTTIKVIFFPPSRSDADPPRDDTKETIARSQAYGVPVRMITGDHHLIAVKTCKDLEMGEVSKPGWPNIQGPKELPMLNRPLSNYSQLLFHA